MGLREGRRGAVTRSRAEQARGREGGGCRPLLARKRGTFFTQGRFPAKGKGVAHV